MEWPPGPSDCGNPYGLTVRDVCDVVYAVLLARAERQALALQQQHAVYVAAGAEMQDEWPSLQAAQDHLDEVLDAEPRLSGLSVPDRELLHLMGVDG